MANVWGQVKRFVGAWAGPRTMGAQQAGTTRCGGCTSWSGYGRSGETEARVKGGEGLKYSFIVRSWH